MIISILCLLLQLQALNNYPNPLYYGNWQLNFFQFDNLTNADFSLFSLFFDVAPLNDTHTFIIDPIENNIKLIGPQGARMSIGKPFSRGYLDGDIRRAKFNSPKAIAFYYRPQQVQGTIPYLITIDQSCDVSEPGCLIKSQPQFNLTFKNIRFNLPSNPQRGAPTLLVADTANNCLRSVDIEREIVTTIAGICSLQNPTVIQDGDYGFNTLLRPYELGVDFYGRVLIIDEFDHARILTNKILTTVLIGACQHFDRQPPNSQGLQVDRLLCNLRWPKWLQPDPDYTKPIDRICNKQYYQCIS